MIELVVPSLWPSTGSWEPTTSSDPAVRALRDRHYSTRRPGGLTVGPPGQRLVLRTHDGLAAWITAFPDVVLDGRVAWRCTLFRNEGPRRSSELVREAMALTRVLWGEPPRDGWLTFVDAAAVASRNPGYCFLVAGWRPDGWTAGGHGRRRLRILRADA